LLKTEKKMQKKTLNSYNPLTNTIANSIFIQAYRHTGIQAYRHTGIQAYRHTGDNFLKKSKFFLGDVRIFALFFVSKKNRNK